MSVILEQDIQAVSIEYLPSEREMEKDKPLVIGTGILNNPNITEELSSRDYYGVKRYVTGLDPEVVRNNPKLTEQEKEVKMAKIAHTLERLEKFFGQGRLDATNEQFWSKVKLQLTRKTTNLDLTDPRKEILFHCIKAGGFSTVAPTLEEAQDEGKKFYIIEPIEFVENRVSPRKLFNAAVEALQKIDNKTFDEIFYVAKFLMPVERGYTKKTSKSLMYEDIDKFIKGEMVSKSKSECARQFMEAIKLSKDILIATCLVKDGMYFGMLYATQAGEIKNNETSGIYGNTVESAVKHLLNPAYDHELDNLKQRVQEKWND